MAIDFLDTKGKTSSSIAIFGLCDDVPPAKNPAYIDETDNSKWIGEVNNPNLIEGNFYAIDNCIEILRPNGEMESRCDGMLHHNNKLSFVELKDRLNRGWLVKAREQLTITVNLFKANHDASTYDNVDAYVCNKQRPIFKMLYSNEIQKFKDDTGLILNVQKRITI
jgi:hypothetical protein